MIALLSSFGSTRVSFAAIVSAAFSGLLASTVRTSAARSTSTASPRPS
jgi:hypothetical protein